MSSSFLIAVNERALELDSPAPKPLSPAAPTRPLRHVIAFKCADWSPKTEAVLREVLDELASIPALGAFHHGADMGLREPGSNMDYTITADFNDQAAYMAFSTHPAYLKVVREVIKPLLAPGAPVARIQFKMEHTSRARQSLMRADPALFNIRFGKAAREDALASPHEDDEVDTSPSPPPLYDGLTLPAPKPLSPVAPARPLRHVIAFKCADFSPATEAVLHEALSTLPSSIPALGAFHHGADMGLREPGSNMDYTITADFNDQAAYMAFSTHPAYLKVVREVIKPLLAPGAPVARIQFKMEHTSRARQSLMRADPALFNIRFGKAAREDTPASPQSVMV